MTESPAQIAYRSYGNTTGNRNFLGQPMPTWDALPYTIQLAWENAVADAIVASATITPAIDVYPVGVFADIKTWAGNPDRTAAHRRLARDIRRALHRRTWRRYLLNGFLAEPRDWPEGLKRCGTGWTRCRALRDLQRRTDRARALLGEVTK
jgi:hypothetical protein